MSRWLPDGLQFTLAPDSIVVARAPHRLNFRARPRPPAAGDMVPVPAGSEQAAPWAAALATLEAVIATVDARGGRHSGATVILSNHFVRYALVPWSDLIDSDEEAISLARHSLHETYGAAAERWELRIAPEDSGALRLVSAVEPELLAALRDLFTRSAIRLVSIQPRLMAVCNRHRTRLARGDAWLALVEPGSLCLALLHDDRIARVHQTRLGDAWAAELATALARESFLADAAAATRQLLLAPAHLSEQPFPLDSPWQIEFIEPAARVDAGGGPPIFAAAGG